ncbi:hypothetical protein SD457_04955 [Coprobacillaceae bacterium CR2/5/TPMF4]|nr:hypothetical protein SD457_04955 [Coprobacillaceae bacterium CR2/5/TPMF4]
MTKPSHSFISSSAVKEMVSHHRSVAGLVPPCVEAALQKNMNNNTLVVLIKLIFDGY